MNNNKQNEHEKTINDFVDKIFNEYDPNNSGQIGKEDLRMCL